MVISNVILNATTFYLTVLFWFLAVTTTEWTKTSDASTVPGNVSSYISLNLKYISDSAATDGGFSASIIHAS